MPTTLSDGTLLEVPSDGDVGPNVSCSGLMSDSHFPFIDLNSYGEEEKSSGASSANPATPKRVGDELSAPPPQRPRTALEGAARREGDEAFRTKRQPPTGSTDDFCDYFTEPGIGHACRHPLWCWPAYKVLLSMGNPTRFSRHHISNTANLRGFVTGIVRQRDLEPISAALAAAGAAPAEPHEFRLTNG